MWPYYTILEATFDSQFIFIHLDHSRCEIYIVFVFISLELDGNTWPVGTDHNLNQSRNLIFEEFSLFWDITLFSLSKVNRVHYYPVR